MSEITYPVTEIFHSIQGEGLNVGRSAWFVRLGGCNLACPGCDEPLHDDPKRYERLTATQIAERITTPAELIVLTGGEPSMYDLTPLIEAIQAVTGEWPVMKIHPTEGAVGEGPLFCIETNGTLPLTELLDFICVSPKPLHYGKGGKEIPYNEETLQRADEIKMVVGWTSADAQAVEEELDFFAGVNPYAQMFLSPLTQFPGNTLIPETTAQAVELVKKFPGVRLSLQTHKWINVR